MVTLLGLVFVVLGMSAANAFPSDAEKRQVTTDPAPRTPICPQDDSAIFQVEDGYKRSRANCTCTYAGDEKGQNGPNADSEWYQNRKCGNASFADEVLTKQTRTQWEIECQCDEVAEEETECLVSYLDGQWMRCAIIVTGLEDPDTFCTQINYLNGSTGHSQAFCAFARAYDWAGK